MNDGQQSPLAAILMQTPNVVSPLADQIEGVGRALTAEELAAVLNVSSKLIFKKAKRFSL